MQTEPAATATTSPRSTRRAYFGRATLGIGALGLAAAGCGAPGASGPTVSAQPVTIRWPEGTGPLETEFAEAFNRRFNEQFAPKITAVMEPFPDNAWNGRYEKWTSMALAGDMPEIVFLCCTFLRPFMMKGFVKQLDSFIRRDWKSGEVNDFYKGPWSAMVVENKTMGLPVYINTNIAFVNKNALKEAGLTYPSENWSKQQFLEYAVKLHQRAGLNSASRWGYDMSFTGLDRNITWIWNNGGEPHDPKDGPVVTKLSYDDPKTIEGLEFIHDFIWKHQVSPVNNDQRGGMNAEKAFINGKTAIWMNASGSAAAISRDAPGTGLDWDFLPLPKGPNGHGARVSTDGYMMSAATPHAEQAWTVLRELVSNDTQTLRAQIRKLQPPRKSAAAVWEKAYAGHNAKLGRVMADTARPDPRAFWKDADQVGKIVGKYMGATMTRNELPVAQAMRQAMEEVRGFYRSAG